jgi:hypothetical protein
MNWSNTLSEKIKTGGKMDKIVKIAVILILGIILALFEIFSPAQTEVNYAVYSLFLAVIVVPPVVATLRAGLSAPPMDRDEKAVALITTGLVLALLQIFTEAPSEIKLGLVSTFGALIVVPLGISGLRTMAKGLTAPPKS